MTLWLLITQIPEYYDIHKLIYLGCIAELKSLIAEYDLNDVCNADETAQ
ncbi:5007_t:CDS:2 [Entrophospora sp. SA101]|nr:5007_t:CDS:2 [Entrophospora sp. SA101]